MKSVLDKIREHPNVEWRKWAEETYHRDEIQIRERVDEVVGSPASAVEDDHATWGGRKEAAQILFDRNHSIFINITGLRRRPIKHTFANFKYGNPVVYVNFEYCLDDCRAIRERWNAQRPNHRGKSWKQIQEEEE